MIRKASLITIFVALSIVIGGYLYTQSRETQVEVKIVPGTMVPPQDKPTVIQKPAPSHVVETVVDPRNVEENVEVVYVDHPENVKAAKEAEEAGIAADAVNKAADEQLNEMLATLDRLHGEASTVLEYSEAFLKEQGLRNSLAAQYLRDKYGGRPLTEQEMDDVLNDPEYKRLVKADMEKEIPELTE